MIDETPGDFHFATGEIETAREVATMFRFKIDGEFDLGLIIGIVSLVLAVLGIGLALANS